MDVTALPVIAGVALSAGIGAAMGAVGAAINGGDVLDAATDGLVDGFMWGGLFAWAGAATSAATSGNLLNGAKPSISSTSVTNKNFTSLESLNSHFGKHGNEFGSLFSTPQEYLNGANYVINNGTYIQEMNGYIRFFGASGKANYAFVGVTHDLKYITTFSVRSVQSLIKYIPWLSI